MTRYLPVYLLIDSSGSMNGEPIHSVNEGLRMMLSALRHDPYALETVKLSLTTFDNEVKEIFPLTPIEDIVFEEIVPPKSGATHLGAALEHLINQYHQDIKQNEGKNNFSPMLFLMTDGKPSDLQLFRQMSEKIKTLKFGAIVGCVAGPKAKREYMEQFADPVVSLETTDSSAFSAFFKWVSDSISAGNKSSGIEGGSSLPPPPKEINIVI
ncbi:MAG: VWA domain-containing protein [Campylobacterales bacterium]|nr:VWA domain-containing protein [Campylobacterales bacterium]